MHGPNRADSYGQTGTGKTHTMEGARIDESGNFDQQEAGIIPRTLQHLFQVCPRPGLPRHARSNRRPAGPNPAPRAPTPRPAA